MFHQAGPLAPRADPAHAVDSNVGDVTGGGVAGRRVHDVGAEVGVGQASQQGAGPAFGDMGGAVDDQVLGQTVGVDSPRLHGQGDPAVPADVAHLLVLGEVPGHDLVAVESHPHHRDLGFPFRA